MLGLWIVNIMVMLHDHLHRHQLISSKDKIIITHDLISSGVAVNVLPRHR